MHMKLHNYRRMISCLLAMLIAVSGFAMLQNGSAKAAVALKKGSCGSSVEKLQNRLNLLGYFDAKIDGTYNDKTEKAVKDFQNLNELKVTGVVDDESWDTIFGDMAIPNDSDVGNDIILKMGSRGPEVIRLQQRLKVLEYYTYDQITGVFGAITSTAVKSFQETVPGLKVDGIAGPKTLAALYVDDPPTREESTSASTSTPVPATTPKPSTSNGSSAANTNANRYNVVLKLGSTGTNVKDMQTALKARGYYKGTISGVFDSATNVAVMAFQKANKILVDGIAGDTTLRLLYTLINDPGDVAPNRYDPGKKISIEKLTWTTVNKSVMARGSEFIIVDVDTGITLKARRWAGTQHCDFEPCTPADTKALFMMFNQRWSWDRRAVWVIIDGRRLAASINGMPHGENTIKTNEFCGQICMHFVGSRVHASNRVDSDHQKMIDKAYQAGINSAK